MTIKTDTTDPLRKIAIFVSTLDQSAADDLLERLPAEQSAAVRNQVMRLDDISEAELEQIAHEFLHGDASQSDTASDAAPSNSPEDSGVELDISLASKLSSPNGYADHVESVAAPTGPPFRFLVQAETDAIAKHLAHENPQVSAIVVAHLPPGQAADLIAHFDPDRQADILRRVSELDFTEMAIVRDIEQHLESLLSEDIRVAKSRLAGLSAVAAILEAAGDKRSSLLGSLSRHQNSLASKMHPVRSRNGVQTATTTATEAEQSNTVSGNTVSGNPAASNTSRAPLSDPLATDGESSTDRPAKAASQPNALVFDDLARLSDLALARIFRESDPQIALLALAGAEAKFVDRLVRQLPRREARSLRGRMENLGPLQLKDLARAQEQIAETASRLAARGEIKLPAARRFTVAA